MGKSKGDYFKKGGGTVGFFDQFSEVQKLKIQNVNLYPKLFKFLKHHSRHVQSLQKLKVFGFDQNGPI